MANDHRHNKQNINQILSDPNKAIGKTSGSNGVLARMWRQMLIDLNINGQQYSSLLQKYVINPRNGIPDNKKDQISARGNLAKELFKAQMTWKTFCKGLKFLGIMKVKFSIKAYHYDGKTTIHSTDVSLGSAHDSFYNQLEQSEENEFVQEIPYLKPANREDTIK